MIMVQRLVLIALGVVGAHCVALASGAGAALPLESPVQASPPPADMTEKVTVMLVAAVLDSLGRTYEIKTSQEGEKYIEINPQSDIPAEQLIITFYDCSPEGACEDILLWSWYDITPRLQVVNQWNADERWTRAYVDNDQDAVLEMDINATGGIGIDARPPGQPCRGPPRASPPGRSHGQASPWRLRRSRQRPIMRQ
jgi:hypothetical protein